MQSLGQEDGGCQASLYPSPDHLAPKGCVALRAPSGEQKILPPAPPLHQLPSNSLRASFLAPLPLPPSLPRCTPLGKFLPQTRAPGLCVRGMLGQLGRPLKKEVREFPLWLSGLRTQLASMRMWVQSLMLFSRLRIRHCPELWCRSQTWLRSGVAMAVA